MSAITPAQSKKWADYSDESDGEDQNPQQSHQHDASHTEPNQKHSSGFQEHHQNQDNKAPRGENDIQEFGRGNRGRGRGGRGKNYQDRNQGGFKEGQSRGGYKDNNENSEQTENRGYRKSRDNDNQDNGGYRGGRGGGYRGNRDNNDHRGGFNKDRRDRRDNDGDNGGNNYQGGYQKRDGNRNQNKDFEARPSNAQQGDYQLPKYLQDLQIKVKEFADENIKIKIRHSKVTEQEIKDNMMGFNIKGFEFVINEGKSFPVIIMDKESTIELIKVKQLKLVQNKQYIQNIDQQNIHLDLIQFPQDETVSPPIYKFMNSKVFEKPILHPILSQSDSAQTDEIQAITKSQQEPITNQGELKTQSQDQNQILRRKDVDFDKTIKSETEQQRDLNNVPEKKDNFQGEYKNKVYQEKKWEEKQKSYKSERNQGRNQDDRNYDRNQVKNQEDRNYDNNNHNNQDTLNQDKYNDRKQGINQDDRKNNQNQGQKNDIQEFFDEKSHKKSYNQDKKRSNQDEKDQSPYVQKQNQQRSEDGDRKKNEIQQVIPPAKKQKPMQSSTYTSKNPFSVLKQS